MEAIEHARLHALTAAERHDYLPKTISEAAAFTPHAWVVEAIAKAAAGPAAVPARTTGAFPCIGQPWPGQGGIYAGLARGEDGAPDHHLILAEQHGEALTWSAAKKWAAGIEVDGHKDFSLPTRFESALLYANVRDQLSTGYWHWTGTQYSVSYAWYQYFYYGIQGYYDKKAEGWARAVRRLTA